jgi:hypothetical protein
MLAWFIMTAPTVEKHRASLSPEELAKKDAMALGPRKEHNLAALIECPLRRVKKQLSRKRRQDAKSESFYLVVNL